MRVQAIGIMFYWTRKNFLLYIYLPILCFIKISGGLLEIFIKISYLFLYSFMWIEEINYPLMTDMLIAKFWNSNII